MTKDEALKLALEALHGFIPYLPLNDKTQCNRYDEAIASINKALKKTEQEPVGWAEHGVINWLADRQFNHTSFLYDTPAERTWVWLTDKDKEEIKKQANYHWEMTTGEYAQIVQNLTEVKLKEKNI